jgi:CheY-like chemotaxis protein
VKRDDPQSPSVVGGAAEAQAPAPEMRRSGESAAEVLELRRRCEELERANDWLRRAAEQLAGERDRYRKQYDGLPVSCVNLDDAGKVLEANASFAAQLGIDSASVSGLSLVALIAEREDVRRFRDHLSAVFRAPGVHTCDLRLRTASGGASHVRLQSTAIAGSAHDRVPRCSTVIAKQAVSAGPPRLDSGRSPLAPPAEALETSAASTSGATVLVIEDESLVRKAVQHYLAMAGYRVLTAVDRAGALERAAQHNGAIDLILADLSLPDGATGPEVVAQIRSSRPDAGVLYMTACPADMLARRGFAAVAGQTLEKPFSKEKLLTRVAGQLATPGARRDAPG